MKLSVIFGVLQMSAGVMMKMVNSLHFKKKYDLWFEFLPQIIFLVSLFGFMDFLIFAKWMIDFTGRTARAPYIISIIINMFLKFGSIADTDDPIIAGQKAISILLFFILIICIPIMLLAKPFLLKADHQKKGSKHADSTEGYKNPYF
jgi:V-type H+-transporting ATPase subunit a